MDLRMLVDPDKAGGYGDLQSLQHWIATQLLLDGSIQSTRSNPTDDWGFLRASISFEREGFHYEIGIRQTPLECSTHLWPEALRCVHKGDDFVVLKPTDDENEWEVVYGSSSHAGSITSPIDDARKNWAFDQTVRRYLKGEKE